MKTNLDLAMESPAMTREMWDEMSNLYRRHTSLQAFFGHLLALAQEQSDMVGKISIATDEGRENNALARGHVQAYQLIVSIACNEMGDLEREPEVDDRSPEEKRKDARRRSETRPKRKAPTRRSKK